MECFGENVGEAVGLLMTYRCTLNCRYCYIQTKRNKDMSLDMAQSILEPFLLKPEGRLDITFMGGETLLAFGVIKPLVEWIKAGSWNRHYRIFGSTNGTLLTSPIKEWLELNKDTITLGLSYDGLPYSQMLNRGNDNVDLEFFIKTWPNQPIQMTINTESVDWMADGVIYLLEKGAQVHPNVAFEQEEWSDERINEYGSQLYKLALYYNSHPNMPPITQFVHDLNEYANSIDIKKPQYEICGAGNGFQVFDVDGQSYPCHILSPLVLEGDKLLRVKEGLVTQTEDFSDSDCDECPFALSCPTCIACNYLYRDCLQKRDKTHCKIMKTEVFAYIKKETMRLIDKEVLTSEEATRVDSIRKIVEFINYEI